MIIAIGPYENLGLPDEYITEPDLKASKSPGYSLNNETADYYFNYQSEPDGSSFDLETTDYPIRSLISSTFKVDFDIPDSDLDSALSPTTGVYAPFPSAAISNTVHDDFLAYAKSAESLKLHSQKKIEYTRQAALERARSGGYQQEYNCRSPLGEGEICEYSPLSSKQVEDLIANINLHSTPKCTISTKKHLCIR